MGYGPWMGSQRVRHDLATEHAADISKPKSKPLAGWWWGEVGSAQRHESWSPLPSEGMVPMGHAREAEGAWLSAALSS